MLSHPMPQAYPSKLSLPYMQQINGALALPGSKSIANRLLLLAALAKGETTLLNLPQGEDVQIMTAALQQMGVQMSKVDVDSDTAQAKNIAIGSDALSIQGHGGALNHTEKHHTESEQHCYVGNAGTAMRFLTAALSVGKGTYHLQGTARMHERPIADLVLSLQQLGASIEYAQQTGYPPLCIRAEGVVGGEVSISGQTSSQFLSALLMAAPFMQKGLQLTIADQLVSEPYVRMTSQLMDRFGVTVHQPNLKQYTVAGGQCYQGQGKLVVEGDASSASYFLGAAAISAGEVTVHGCGSKSLQGDVRFAEVLSQMGAEVAWGDDWIRVKGGRALQGKDVNLEDIPDAAMTLAVVALFAKGETTIRGIANWRVKETDRMAAMVTELTKLGAIAEPSTGALRIVPPATLQPAHIDTYDDHRMAMAFSLAAFGTAGMVINEPACVAKTFPHYFEQLALLNKS